jgi:hypothetical protein
MPGWIRDSVLDPRDPVVPLGGGGAACSRWKASGMWKISKVEPFRYLPSLHNRNFDVTGAVDDAINDVTTEFEFPTNKAATARLRNRVAFVCPKIELHNIDALYVDMRKYTDIRDHWYVNVRGCNKSFEREPRR